MLFNSVYGIDPDTAWATGYRYASGGAPDEDGLIVKVTNGGRNCDFQASGTTEDLNDISAADQLTAWAVGDNGTIIKTEDGGDLEPPELRRDPGPRRHIRGEPAGSLGRQHSQRPLI